MQGGLVGRQGGDFINTEKCLKFEMPKMHKVSLARGRVTKV